MEKVKKVNFRIVFFAGVFFALGIFLAREIFSPNFLLIGVISALAVALVVFSVLKKKLFKITLILCSFIVGVSYYFIGFDYYQAPTVYEEEMHISGTIDEIVSEGDTYKTVVLENAKLDQVECKNILLTIFQSYENFKVGDVLEFDAETSSVKYYELGEFNTYYYKKNIGYIASENLSNITIAESNPSFVYNVQKYVKSFLYKYMTPDSARIAYASIFGDRSEIDYDIYQNFLSVGIVHLLAVSGLHIGFIVLLLLFFFRKLKINKKVSFVVVSLLLVFYCYLCSFSPSVVRASLMSVFFMVGDIFGKEKDNLTSISLAMILILIFKPLYVFDVGFVLSFVCVFSIFILAKPIAKVFEHIKLGKGLSSAIAVILAVQIGIFPILIKLSGSYSFMSIFANFLCIPVFEFAFISLLIFLPIVLLLPFMNFLLYVPDFLFNTIIVIAQGLFDNSLTMRVDYFGKFFTIFYFACLFLISEFFMASSKIKCIMISLMLCLSFSFVMFDYEIKRFGEQTVGVINIYGNNSYILSDENGERYFIDFGNICESYEKAEKYLEYNKINEIGNLVVIGDGGNSSYEKFITDYNVKNIIDEDRLAVEVYAPISSEKMIILSICGKKIALLSSSLTTAEISNINSYFSATDFDLVLYGGEKELDLNCDLLISNFGTDKSKNLKAYGNFTMPILNAKIDAIRRLD